MISADSINVTMEWMNNRHSELAFVFVILGLIAQHVAAVKCPRDMFASVFACFRYIRGPNAHDLVIAGADLHAVKARCEDGSFNKAVDCVRNLHHVCRYSERQALLHHLSNTGSMDRGFKLFCDNLFLYAENKECLLKEALGIQRCIEQHRGRFDYEMNTRHDSEAAKMEGVCNFLTGMTSCIDRPVRDSCDSALADIVLHFMSGITPPVCEPYSPNGAHSPYTDICSTFYWIIFFCVVNCLLNFNSGLFLVPNSGR